MGLEEYVKAKAILMFMNRTDPEKLAITQADAFDIILDGQLGDKRSEPIQKVMVPWIEKFVVAFNKRLLEGAK